VSNQTASAPLSGLCQGTPPTSLRSKRLNRTTVSEAIFFGSLFAPISVPRVPGSVKLTFLPENDLKIICIPLNIGSMLVYVGRLRDKSREKGQEVRHVA
jgi:hypothetical protein